MEVKPLTTLNLIDKLCGEKVKSSPWIASTSGSHDHDHEELDVISTALTLHLPCCESTPPTANKRKKKATLVEDPESSAASIKGPKCRKLEKMELEKKSGLVVQDNENESFLSLTLRLLQFSSTAPKDHENENKYKLLKRKRDRELFQIKKRLTQSDVSSLSRLLVHKDLVLQLLSLISMLSLRRRSRAKKVLEVIVKDSDVISGYEQKLRFKFLKSSGSFVFNGSWMKSFVRWKKLKMNDVIGLYWDSLNSKFHFSLLAAANQP